MKEPSVELLGPNWSFDLIETKNIEAWMDGEGVTRARIPVVHIWSWIDLKIGVCIVIGSTKAPAHRMNFLASIASNNDNNNNNNNQSHWFAFLRFAGR